MKFSITSQKIISFFGLLGFVISISLIVGLYYFYGNARKNLADAAKNLRAIGNASIYDTVYVDSVIPIDTDISIDKIVPVHLNMELDDSIKIMLTKNYRLNAKIPIRLPINQNIYVDTLIALPDALKLTTSGNISIDQRVKIFKKIKLPLKITIPLQDELLTAKLQGKTSFTGIIPVKMMITDSLSISLDLTIPIDQKAKIIYPIRKMAMVSFPKKLKIKGVVPIHLKIPIEIPLSKTALKKYLDSTAANLDRILPIKWQK